MLSQNYYHLVEPMNERVALYLPPEVFHYESKDRGSRWADPQTFHIGEALAPMLVEAFQSGFSEFLFLETEPTPELLRRYAVNRLAVVRVKDFANHVTMRGQTVGLVLETAVFDTGMNPIARYDSRGSSEAEKIFAKKGGPEVNLNAAVENAVRAAVQHLQDREAVLEAGRR